MLRQFVKCPETPPTLNEVEVEVEAEVVAANQYLFTLGGVEQNLVGILGGSKEDVEEVEGILMHHEEAEAEEEVVEHLLKWRFSGKFSILVLPVCLTQLLTKSALIVKIRDSVRIPTKKSNESKINQPLK